MKARPHGKPRKRVYRNKRPGRNLAAACKEAASFKVSPERRKLFGAFFWLIGDLRGAAFPVVSAMPAARFASPCDGETADEAVAGGDLAGRGGRACLDGPARFPGCSRPRASGDQSPERDENCRRHRADRPCAWLRRLVPCTSEVRWKQRWRTQGTPKERSATERRVR